MARYFGEPQRNPIQGTINQHKGAIGEKIVLDQLLRLLSNDFIVLGYPQVGRYEPDFLVLSTTFGIRLLEVKNISLDSIQKAKTNGLLVFRNELLANPMQQAKIQTNSVIQLLERELPQHFSGKAPVGYLVVHTGFTRQEFERKFPQLRGGTDYWRHHIMIDEFKTDLVERLHNSAKFVRGVSPKLIEDVLNLVKFQEDQLSDASLVKLEMETRLEYLEKKFEEKLNVVTDSSNPKDPLPIKNSKIKTVVAVLILVLLLIGVVRWYALHDNKASESIISTVDVHQYEGQQIAVYGIVERFYFDKKSGTKFIEIRDSSGKLDGVILNEIKVPYINEGDTYTFYGMIEQYKGRYQLLIKNFNTE